jgi:lipopolysaccharide transport system permease protein
LSHAIALWSFRGFVYSSVKREFQAKYRTSLLGIVWMVLQPLALVSVYILVFSQIMGARLGGSEGRFAYGIYLCAGLLTWGLFAEVLGRTINVFVDNANLLKKLSFPRLCLPLIVRLGSLLNFSIIFGLFVLFLLASGNFPGWVFLGLFPVLFVQVLFSVGLGVILAVFNVFFRDVGQLFAIVLQFWFWLTPIVYPREVLPGWVSQWLVLNPMAALIESYQLVLVHARWPNWVDLLPTFLLALLLCFLGLIWYRRHAPDMVDEL